MHPEQAKLSPAPRRRRWGSAAAGRRARRVEQAKLSPASRRRHGGSAGAGRRARRVEQAKLSPASRRRRWGSAGAIWAPADTEVVTKGKPVKNRRGPATVSGEPSPCPYGSHWEMSREGWATALSHESGDLVATWQQTSFREKRSGHANRERGPDTDVASGRVAGCRPGDEAGGKGRDEERGPGGGDGDHGAHAGLAARGGAQRDHGERLQDLSLRDGG